MVSAIIDSSKEEFNSEMALYTFVKLAPGLVNDKSEDRKKYTALSIRKLVESVNQSALNDLFLSTRDWLDSDKVNIQQVAFQED